MRAEGMVEGLDGFPGGTAGYHATAADTGSPEVPDAVRRDDRRAVADR